MPIGLLTLYIGRHVWSITESFKKQTDMGIHIFYSNLNKSNKETVKSPSMIYIHLFSTTVVQPGY